jgi:serine/threonine protein kinase
MQERDLFIAALEIDDLAARWEYLERICTNNPVLLGRIQKLLNRVTEAADFLDHPAADLCSDHPDDWLLSTNAISSNGDSRTINGDTSQPRRSQIELAPQLLAAEFDKALDGNDETTFVPGTMFGRYRIDCLLGSGGMGVVYLARDTRMERHVALKIPRFDADGKLHLIERFRREARVMASVQHRNLCPIINVDDQRGRHYLTMAYIDGSPLSQLIRNGSSFTSTRIAEWIRKLAMALDAAHQAGVVHRDLKPANIIIDQSGEPILMDFGLAWMVHEPDPRVTLAGAIIGTPAYMSPEQSEGEPDRVGPASDIYSLGVIMYELLAGCPIRSGSVTRVLYKLMNETPLRPSEIRGGVDLNLEEICWKAIARRPEDRFATAAEFANALCTTQVSSADPKLALLPAVGVISSDDAKPQWTQRNRTKIVFACVLLFGILAVAAQNMFQHSIPSPLTGSGNHLPLAPMGRVLEAVNYIYLEDKTGFSGTWSADAMPAWQGTFTATGLRPAGFYYTPEVCRHDFSGLASGVLPAGTYFTIFQLNQNDNLTLTAYDSSHMLIVSPWLNRNPVCQWGNGTGAGFPGLPELANMPGWDWKESTGTYTFDGNTIIDSALTIALSSCEPIGFLEVTRGTNRVSFGLAAPTAAPKSPSRNR